MIYDKFRLPTSSFFIYMYFFLFLADIAATMIVEVRQKAADYASPKPKPLCAAREVVCGSWKSADRRRVQRAEYTSHRVHAVATAVITTRTHRGRN